jgi:hypothetical protein
VLKHSVTALKVIHFSQVKCIGLWIEKPAPICGYGSDSDHIGKQMSQYPCHTAKAVMVMKKSFGDKQLYSPEEQQLCL